MQFNNLTEILSRQNKKAKNWLKLNTNQGVKKQGLVLIEGIRSSISALQNGADIDSFLFAKTPSGEVIFDKFYELFSTRLKEEKDYFLKNAFRVDEELFQSIADVRNPQGIILIVRKPDLLSLKTWQPKQPDNKTKLVILDQIADPGNLGTIIRTADAFGYDGIILMKGSADPYNPKVLRSTMASIFSLNLIEIQDYQELNTFIKDKKLHLLVSDMDGISLPAYDREKLQNGHILAIGNEAHGIHQDLLKMADDVLTIPMTGSAESLNAAIAFAIMAYQLEQAL